MKPGGAKSWAFLFRWKEPGQTGAGRLREMGLGAENAVSLSAARAKADVARAQAAAGVDPILEARTDRTIPTFGEVADTLIADLSSQWRNDKHKAQWSMTLREYAKPLRSMPVDQVKTEDVLDILKPLWTTKPETASRVRGRIERVLDAAKAKGARFGENPARWRGHLDHLLPKRHKLTRGHHAALPYPDLPAFMVDLRGREALAALLLEFTILTASRSGETIGARWSEINIEAKLWTVPPSRMKAGREHRVPLTERAVQILLKLRETRVGEFVFPGNLTKKPHLKSKERPLSGAAMEMLLRRMQRNDITVHGFRSTFRDWAGECTHFPREIAEAALAHTVGDETERAYRRGDALEKRRKMMEAWAKFCEPKASAKVVALNSRALTA